MAMNRCLRGLFAGLVVAALILVDLTPAAAAAQDFEDRGEVNIIFDALLLRPMGLAVTVLGGALFALPVAPIVALTRPQDLHKPLDYLVMRPYRYTFQDPLGHH
jgi:hypothetical protein